jgi:hypothetical protein
MRGKGRLGGGGGGGRRAAAAHSRGRRGPSCAGIVQHTAAGRLPPPAQRGAARQAGRPARRRRRRCRSARTCLRLGALRQLLDALAQRGHGHGEQLDALGLRQGLPERPHGGHLVLGRHLQARVLERVLVLRRGQEGSGRRRHAAAAPARGGGEGVRRWLAMEGPSSRRCGPTWPLEALGAFLPPDLEPLPLPDLGFLFAITAPLRRPAQQCRCNTYPCEGGPLSPHMVLGACYSILRAGRGGGGQPGGGCRPLLAAGPGRCTLPGAPRPPPTRLPARSTSDWVPRAATSASRRHTARLPSAAGACKLAHAQLLRPRGSSAAPWARPPRRRPGTGTPQHFAAPLVGGPRGRVAGRRAEPPSASRPTCFGLARAGAGQTRAMNRCDVWLAGLSRGRCQHGARAGCGRALRCDAARCSPRRHARCFAAGGRRCAM